MTEVNASDVGQAERDDVANNVNRATSVINTEISWLLNHARKLEEENKRMREILERWRLLPPDMK